MYTALYRTQRPEVFSEILGQEHIVRILQYQVATNTTSHAYLFCGTRGTGKTTTARILAKAVNCLAVPEPVKRDETGAITGGDGRPCGRCANCLAIKNGTFMDVIEIDAASNNGVENVRELRESVKYPPAVGRKKVYIIDEVHMLSPGASNALLKTLEEPPENVMFILATTEPQKLLPTILSRCMRLDFKRVPQNILVEGMRRIVTERGIEMTDGALRLLANHADGSVRDGLSILDQVIAGGDRYIDRDKVLAYLGTAGEDFFIELTELVAVHKVADALVLLDAALADGKDVKQIMKDWVGHYRSLLLTKFMKNPEDMLNMSTENVRRVREQSMQISLEEINDAILRLSRTINDARWSTQPRILLELAIVAIATGLIEEGDGQVVRRRPVNMAQVAPAPAPAIPAAQTAAPAPAPAVTQVAPAPAPATADVPASTVTTSAGQTASAGPASTQTSAAGATAPVAQTAAPAPATPAAPSSTGAAGATTPAAPADQAASASLSEETLLMEPGEMEELWHQIFEEGEGSASSFNLIRSGSHLQAVTESRFVVVAKTSFAKRYVEKMQAELEALMERHIGRRLRMICIEESVAPAAASGSDAETEALAKRVSEVLGIPVEVVDD